MYAIIEEESNEWVTEASVGFKPWVEGMDTHLTSSLSGAAVWSCRASAAYVRDIVNSCV
jgi:hypothetical protein